ISPSWMVSMVDELERRELLARKPHVRDRRVRNLHLTAAGKKLLRQAERHAKRFDEQVTAALSETELRQLLDLLDRVSAGIGLQPGAHAAMRERRGSG
ncbi:MAG TPA: hypothetical protein VKB70_02765, partial [Gaiellaceae bacterium]|nr:hypothetical protein [Gaiellaceae bacterium]